MSLKDRATKFLRQLLTAKGEDGTDYDGPFSHPGEYHSAAIGIGVGTTAVYTNQPMLLVGLFGLALGIEGFKKYEQKFKGAGVVQEVRREPWYCIAFGCGAWVVGAAYTGMPLLPFPL